MAQDVPWDAETEGIISDINQTISKKYNISLRGLLINPNRYAGKKDIAGTVKKIKADVGAYFKQLADEFKDEQAKLNTELEAADEQYKQIDSVISGKAAAARVPYVKPLYINRNLGNEETIVFESYTNSLDSLIGKLVNSSNYVADTSASYKDKRLGSWLFSGARNYTIAINPPVNPLLLVENSSKLINDMLDSIISRFG